MNYARNIAQQCEQDVYEEVRITSLLQENAQRGKNDGENDLELEEFKAVTSAVRWLSIAHPP